VVAAGLLHNVYNSGDFGDGRSQRSQARRKRIRRAVGSEVETYVARFSDLHWESRTIQNARHDPDKLDPMDRTMLLILCADHLEHLLDLDSLYYENTRYYIDHSKIAVEIAEKQALRPLAAKLKEAIRVAEFAERPVDLPATRICNSLFVVAPSSCRMRVSVRAREILIPTARRLGSKLRRMLTFLCRRSTRFVQSPLRASQRYTIGREAKSTPLGECLEANSEDFRRLFSEDAVLKRVATGFRFTEGPVWVPEEKALLFSDIPANKILKLTADGRVKTFRKPSGNSNGLTRDKEGRLIACEHANRRVTRTERDGSISVLADRFQGKRLNSPNDIVVKSDGAIYFTDPSYGISAAQQEQPVQGVYRLSPDGTQLTLVAGDLERPNGLAFSPDEKGFT
jgi:YD repeat-containing protein